MQGDTQEERGALDEDGRERELLYERAERLSNALVSMGHQLKEAIDGVNAAAATSMGDPNQPIGKLVRILNNQLQALTHLDARTDALAAKLDNLSMGGCPLIQTEVQALAAETRYQPGVLCAAQEEATRDCTVGRS